MYKLVGHGLVRGEWFEPESQQMTLIERGSTSTITLGPDAPEIGFNDWILDDEWPEGDIIWRVKSIDEQADTETRSISLEHVIRLLEDPKLFEEIETSSISGGDYCTARQAIEYLLARQSDWVLGDCINDVSLPYEFSASSSIYDCVEEVSDTLEDAEWWYDLSRYPFVLHIRKRSSTVMSEMRGGRNVSTLKRTISRSGMYTRIWPVGENDLHISGAYLSKNENLYGRIDKVETNSAKTSEASLRAWANAMLRKHCEPLVTITIAGLYLVEETGEDLDWIKLNRVCRCPLPEYGTTILERVIKLNWRDRKKEPENVTVTLGNNTADVTELTKTVSETSKSSGRGARGQAKQNYLFEANGEHLLYEVFDECGHLHGQLRMTSESLRIGFENLVESTRSEFYMTSESLRVSFENEIACTRSEFQMTSESLRVQFENEINSTRSEFQITSESLRTQFENELNSTRSEFQITSESLRTQFENELNSTRSEFQITSESLRTQFENELNSTRSEFQITSESLRTTFENELNSTRSEFQITSDSLRVHFENEISSTRSEFQMTSDSLRVSFENEISSTRTLVEQTDRSWKAAVSGVTGADGKVTAASISVAINNAGEGVATIDADKVYIGNAKSTTVIAGKCSLSDVTADYISGKIATLSVLNVAAISATGNITTSNGVVMAPYIYLGGTGNARSLANAITALTIERSGNTYTLKKQDFDDGNWVDVGSFSRATTLTGTWGSGKFTVNASPQGESFWTDLVQGSVTWDGNTGTIPINAIDKDSGGNSYFTGRNVSVDASSIYNKAVPASGQASGRHGSAWDWDFIIKKNDGTTKSLTIDVSDIVVAARSGYTLGTFRQATVTLQGGQDSVYIEATSGGTNYYTAGTETTYYNAGSGTKYDRGTGLSARPVVSSGGTVFYTAGTQKTYYNAGKTYTYYAEGSTVTRYTRSGGIRLSDDGTARHYDVNGNLIMNAHWYHVVSSGGTMYYQTSSANVVEQGREVSVTVQGSSVEVTPIGSTSVRLGAAGTYYPGNGGSFTPQGSSVKVTPINASSKKMFLSTIRYKAGTTDTTTYYTKS